jgi:hypothetical protein
MPWLASGISRRPRAQRHWPSSPWRAAMMEPFISMRRCRANRSAPAPRGTRGCWPDARRWPGRSGRPLSSIPALVVRPRSLQSQAGRTTGEDAEDGAQAGCRTSGASAASRSAADSSGAPRDRRGSPGISSSSYGNLRESARHAGRARRERARPAGGRGGQLQSERGTSRGPETFQLRGPNATASASTPAPTFDV